MTSINIKAERQYDCICMGRSCMDLYSNDPGVSFPEIKSFNAYVGGSPTNIAVGASKLGLKTALLTAVGKDPVGDFVLNYLTKEKVDTRYIPTKPGRRTSCVILGIEPPDKFPLVYYRDNCADNALSIDDAAAVPLDETAVFVVTGTNLSRETSRSATLYAVEKARRDGAKVVLDIDFRADQWPDVRYFGSAIRALVPLLDVVIGTEDEIMQGNCLEKLLVDAEQALALRSPGGVSSGQVVFSWADEWWKAFDNQAPPANCINTDWTAHDSCIGWVAAGYTDFDCPQETPPAQCTADSGIQEEWWGIARAEPTGPADLRDAYDRLGDSWNLGAVNSMEVITYNPGTGDTTLSFDPGAGSTDHTLYYGPLNDVSTYGYTGSASGLGADGSGAATLPAGDLFWVVVGRNAGAEGCYGQSSACSERPASPGASIPQAANRTGSVPQCP